MPSTILVFFLNRCPVLYEVWYPYKYAVIVCYRRFFPLFVFLTQGRLPSGTEVYPHPKLIYVERVMAALLVLVSSCEPALERLKAPTGDARPDMSERQRTTIVKGIVVVLLEYIPALFLCGFLVRNCNRANQQNSDDALHAAHYGFHILVHLCWGAKHTTEYVRTLGVSFLFWGRWEQTIPRKCHSEEMGEALLARLVEKLRLNPNSGSLDDCFDLFLLTPAARTDLKDLHGSHLQNDTIKLLWRNLNTFVRQISDGQLVSPVLWKSKVKTVEVMEDWPKVPLFPISLYRDMSIDHLQDVL